MKLSDFDYRLPKSSIAQSPADQRDHSKLLHLPMESESLLDHPFSDIPGILKAANVKLLVLNDTKVIPARLFGKKETGGKVELLLLEPQEDGLTWASMIKTSKPLSPGALIILLSTRVLVKDRQEQGRYLITFPSDKALKDEINSHGVMPLPPYIKRDDGGSAQQRKSDRDRYQTIYAKNEGAIAAPTAGLHFTKETFDALSENGIDWVYVTLHVGAGTFAPIRSENVSKHKMHFESFSVSNNTATRINEAYANKEKVLAVGTTSCRALESAIDENGKMQAISKSTDLYILPGYKFKAIDGLLTNFHLPKSTLLMLVSALAGKDRIIKAYNHAVKKDYRFFSYGDAMLIV